MRNITAGEAFVGTGECLLWRKDLVKISLAEGLKAPTRYHPLPLHGPRVGV